MSLYYISMAILTLLKCAISGQGAVSFNTIDAQATILVQEWRDLQMAVIIQRHASSVYTLTTTCSHHPPRTVAGISHWHSYLPDCTNWTGVVRRDSVFMQGTIREVPRMMDWLTLSLLDPIVTTLWMILSMRLATSLGDSTVSDYGLDTSSFLLVNIRTVQLMISDEHSVIFSIL